MTLTLVLFFQFYVPVQILLPYFTAKVSDRFHLITEYALRFALVLFTCEFPPEISILYWYQLLVLG